VIVCSYNHIPTYIYQFLIYRRAKFRIVSMYYPTGSKNVNQLFFQLSEDPFLRKMAMGTLKSLPESTEKITYRHLYNHFCKTKHKLGFMGDSYAIQYTVGSTPKKERCKYVDIGENLRSIHQTFALARGSPYTDVLTWR